jgi:DNA polymerase I-like protein with 3'-5' exonuclease and polymerase domains
MAAHDGGDYVDTVVQGNKENETDVHSLTCFAIGLKPKEKYTLGGKTGYGRDFAKTFIYAFLYGAGDAKLGSIMGKGAAAGKAMKAAFLAKLPALAKLKAAVERVAREKGTLRSLDGAPMKVRSQHSALNTLIQGAGALVMKKAMVLLDRELQIVYDFAPGEHYEFVANIHDEWQIECDEKYADRVGRCATEAIAQAGFLLKMRCPMAGEYKVGRTWADTH